MNERIRELAEQAGINCVVPTAGTLEYLSKGEVDHLKKFAELIVKECATTITNDDLAKDCDTFLVQSWARGMRYSAEVIKEYFGVNDDEN